MANESDKLLQSIDAKLGQILKLSALQMASGMKQAPAIQILNAAGLERKVIAEILNTTPNTVSVTLAKAKAKAKTRENETPEIVPAEGQVT
jgi:DNA-binding NarL/FixJ family response regulator